MSAIQRSLARGATLVAFVACASCTASTPARPTRASLPQTTGDLEVPGLRAPVRIVRDTWGVPHIEAESQDDLFFAQGFVQAQDRLFQMDLWRRAATGRVSEVLGANFAARDVTTRRVQPPFLEDDVSREWAAYPSDTRGIVSAFVRGINAWVAIARRNLPDEFRLAGWLPEPWTPEDLLSRTDAFTASGNVLSEIFRAQLVAEVGAARADVLLPLDPPAPTIVPAGVDPGSISYRIADTLRRVGTAPFFAALAAPIDTPMASNAWAVSGARSASGHPLLANDPHGPLSNPGHWYLVHLKAPGWDVAGATEPWAPGVAIGHNERVAWGATAFDADVEDLYVERTKPDDPSQVEEEGKWVPIRHAARSFAVKGHDDRLDFTLDFTRHGAVVAVDSERHLAFALRWTGLEPGTAPALAGLSIDRARSTAEFRQALASWRAPARLFVFADTDGNIGMQAAGLVPIRSTWTGTLPVPGWNSAYEWRGWRQPDDLPHASDSRSGILAAANERPSGGHGPAAGFEWRHASRANRLRELLGARSAFSVPDFVSMQQDVQAWNAGQLVPLLQGLHATEPAVEAARALLLEWDRRVTVDSTAASIFVAWERSLARGLIQGRIEPFLTDEWLKVVSTRLDVLVPALTRPSRAWFPPPVEAARDRLLLDGLAAALSTLRSEAGPDEDRWAWGLLHRVTFAHPLGVTDKARSRYNLGPFALGGYRDTVMASDGPGFGVDWGASFRQILDVSDWDRSLVTNAPGQSERPDSPHFGDLVERWVEGEYVTLPFTDAAVEAGAADVLTLRSGR